MALSPAKKVPSKQAQNPGAALAAAMSGLKQQMQAPTKAKPQGPVSQQPQAPTKAQVPGAAPTGKARTTPPVTGSKAKTASGFPLPKAKRRDPRGPHKPPIVW